jgi:hypothetical protein
MSNNNEYVRKQLLKKYPPETKGRWIIKGEDPNCDFGGYHSNPDLALVYGTYKNVIEYAFSLKGFFSWGSGGNITLQEPTENLFNVDDHFSPEMKKLREDREALQAKLDELDIKLNQKR